MTYTLADAIRDQFERDHPRGRNTLLCGWCRRRKDHNDFRETPWHGRAAACKPCEGGGWHKLQDERVRWELEQAREKLRAYQRYAARLKFRLLLATAPKSADLLRAYEAPFVDAIERAQRRWAPAWAEVLTAALPEDDRPKRRRRSMNERTTR